MEIIMIILYGVASLMCIGLVGIVILGSFLLLIGLFTTTNIGWYIFGVVVFCIGCFTIYALGKLIYDNAKDKKIGDRKSVV